MMRGIMPPSIQKMNAFNVNAENQPVVIWQPLYDYQAYPALGFTGETLFFAVPIGQAGKTIEDTNMRLGGQLPTPHNVIIVSQEIVFRAGTGLVISATGAIVAANWNDVSAFSTSRMSYSLRIGDKIYSQEAPLGVLPQQFRIAGGAALSDSTTAAANAVTVIDYAVMCGPLYQVVPMRLISNQEFGVAINSPALVPTPSTVAGRFGIRLHGPRYSLAQ